MNLVPHDGSASDLARSHNLIDLYLERFDRANTRSAYRNDLTRFFGTDDVSLAAAQSVTFVEMNRYVAGLESDGLKASTIKRKIAAVRGFYEWLIALGVMEQNPAHRQVLRHVRSVRTNDRPIVVLTAEQAGRLLAAADLGHESGVRDYTLAFVLLHLVLRRSEAAAMDVEHLRPLGPYWVLDLPTTKGGADQYVKVPPHTAEVLQDHFATYDITSGPIWRSFSNNSRGTRLTGHSIYRIIKQMAERAGLQEQVGAHTMRHTGCTLALEAGASLQQVQTHARHKNIETTMVYIHQRDKLRDSAADFIRVDTPRPPKTSR